MSFSRNFRKIGNARGFSVEFWWHGTGPRLSHGELDEIWKALKFARDEFLKWESPEHWHADDGDMHSLRYLLSEVQVKNIRKMNNLQVKWAVYREVEWGSLIFVPPRDEVKRYIEEVRKKRSRSPKFDDRPFFDQAIRAAAIRVSAPSAVKSSTTPVRTNGVWGPNFELGDAAKALGPAEAFEYTPDAVSGEADQVVGMPFKGAAGSWASSMPGTMPQLRQYGPGGTPMIDIDFEAHHGNPNPHAHNWEGYTRDEGAPVSLLPW